MKTKIIFFHYFFRNILEISRRPGLYLNIKVLKYFFAKKVTKIFFLEQFSLLKIKSKISENYVFFFFLQDLLKEIVFSVNNENLFLSKKKAQQRIYLSPIKFIQKNFPRNLFYSYDFYCEPILHEKDFLWNNLVSDFFSQDLFKSPILYVGYILIRLKILNDTLWLLNEQIGKILKRRKHGCKFTYCLKFFKIFFLKIKYPYQSTSCYKNLFGKRKKIRILRKKKLKNCFFYLKMILKKENLFLKYFLIKKEIFIFLIELSKLLESYVFDIENSSKRRENHFDKFTRENKILN